jgi:hypothetical protein
LTDKTNGYSVWKTKATGNPPYTLTPVVLFGAGRGTTMVSVVSMHVFNGALYVGSSGWAPNPYPPCEMIRINPDDSWQVVVGNPRRDPSTHVLKSPLSGLPDGFGNPYNAHIWRMEDHDGVLYAGTNDVSWWHRSLLQWIPGLAQGFGFDLFASADGVHWTTITKSGFGVPANYGCRTMISSPDGLFVGSADEAVGTQVFLGRGATDALPAAAPTRTLAEVQGGSPLISWNPSSTTSQYSVYRAPYRKMEVPNPDGEAANNDVVNVPGAFSKIGTTDKPFFQDRSASGSSPFLYYVQADGPRGQSSNPSNFVYVSPSATIPPVTFNQVQNAVGELAGIATLASSGPDYGLFDQALAAQAKGDLATALSALESLQSQVAKNPNGTLSSAKAQDLEIMIGRLARRVKLAKSGLIPRKSLDKSR